MNYLNNNIANMPNENNIAQILFWNVDTQYDFMRDDASFKGALSVKDARKIENNLEKLTKLAENKNIKVVNTADWHTLDDVELSITPDYKNTYPAHCMKNTKGAKYVPATEPKIFYAIDWNDKELDVSKLAANRNILLYKNKFNVFEGNSHTNNVLNQLNPTDIYVYGVATNVCVNFAVEELLKRNKNVYVVTDAIKELPNEIAATPLDTVFATWKENGAKFITTTQLHNKLK